MAKLKPHQRINDTFLAHLEKPVLIWLAARLPDCVTPDFLTGLGLLAAGVIFLGYWLTGVNAAFLWLVNFGLILNWFGDSLDGTLARYRKIERPRFGYFIDHTVDAITQLLIVLGIGLSPYVQFKFALFALIGYFMLSIHTYIMTYVRGVFKLSYGKLGPTEVRLIMFLANTFVYLFGMPTFRIALGRVTLFESICMVSGVALILMFVFSTIKQAVELATSDH